jgi:lipopolysaccharide export system permease protein
VRILTRYILREHLGPLGFALSALTSLLLLQYVARQLDKLVGKGLPWRVIGEFLLLSLPFTVAMTLPMAVLVATLHAFGRLAAEHEVTAFKASGVRVRTLMAPVLLASAVLSLLMVGFNDQVLPRANHRLSMLLSDIVNVRPTVALEEQVLKPMSESFYMKVGWLDPGSNRMRDVEIYDLQNSAERKSVYADSGTFALTPDSADLLLVLYDGVQLQFPQGNSRGLQRTTFREQVLRVQGVARGFSASDRDGRYRTDREMGICELQREYVTRADEYESRRQRWIAQLRAEALSAGSGDSVLRVPRPRPARGGLAKLYCETIPGWFAPKQAEAAEPAAPSARVTEAAPASPAALARTREPAQDPVPPGQAEQAARDSAARDSAARDEAARAEAASDSAARAEAASDSAARAEAASDSATRDSLARDLAAQESAAAEARRLAMAQTDGPPPAIFAVTPESLNEGLVQMSSYAVEVEKKFALSMACFVFVLFGPPIALRFPRGGVGVTIGVSLVVFGAYYVCLMAGEALGDKGRIPPFVAMWAANVIFTLAGLVLLLRVERTTDSSRGGGLRDWWADRAARRALRRSPAVPAGAADGRRA